MKKVLGVLSAILLSVGSFANVNLDSNPANVEIVSSELMNDEFDNCYTITTYRICDLTTSPPSCETEVVIWKVQCPQQ